MKPPKPGETVGLRRGQSGQPAGLHLVREVLEDGRLAVTSWITHENFTVPIEDIVGWDGEAITVAPRPPRQKVAAPAPETEPELLVTISVPDPARKGYTFPTRDNPNPADVILPEDSPHLNHNRMSHKVIRVPASLVGIVLGGVDGSHLVGEHPQPHDAFAEQD